MTTYEDMPGHKGAILGIRYRFDRPFIPVPTGGLTPRSSSKWLSSSTIAGTELFLSARRDGPIDRESLRGCIGTIRI